MQARYDKIADWYDESVRNGSLTHDIVLPSLFAMIGSVQGKRICDLACGQGVIARQLARNGALIVGVDISEKLLEVARNDEEAETLGIIYIQDDAQSLTSLEDATFDGVVCNLALMDIPDFKQTLQSVQRILRPGDGLFSQSLIHAYIHQLRGG